MNLEETPTPRVYARQSLASSCASNDVEIQKKERIRKYPKRRLFQKWWISNPLLDDLHDDESTDKRQRNNDHESGGLDRSKTERITKYPKRRLYQNWRNNGDLDDTDKVGDKRQRYDLDESGLEESKKKKTDFDDEVEKQFNLRKKKSNKERDAEEIAFKVERLMVILEIAVEDDVELHKKGKPAINKLMKLPLLKETLSKKQLQYDFLDHGVLHLLKTWLEPLPDGSLPNITIRSAVLNILNDLSINLDQEDRREQLKQSGLGKVIMFLSQSDEETTLNKRLASELVTKWSRVIYNKSTRYADMLSPEEKEKQHQMLLSRQNKTAPNKVSKARPDFDTDIDFSEQPDCKLAPGTGKVERARVPQVMSMDFTLNPKEKVDEKLIARVKYQMDESHIHDKIMDKLKQIKRERKKGMQAFKISVNGRTVYA